MNITLESVFLFGVISAKTNPAHQSHIEKTNFDLPLPSVFIPYEELLTCAPDFCFESLVKTLYEMMAHGLIQCSFLDVAEGIYVATSPSISEIFHNQNIEVDCKRGPIMTETAVVNAILGA
jgi:hypothetical protein